MLKVLFVRKVILGAQVVEWLARMPRRQQTLV